MAKKKPTATADPTIETPTTPGTVAQEAPPKDASPADHAESGDGDRSAESGEPGRQTAAPTCPECGTRCVAGSSPGGVTYYYCPVHGCGFSTKQPRPASGLGVPTCPYHKRPCELHRRASNPFFIIFRCPEPGCQYTEKRPRPNLPTRRHLADQAGDQSAR